MTLDGGAPVSWWEANGSAPAVAYRGRLKTGARLRYGVDGWQGPVREVAFEAAGDGVAVAEVGDVDGHLTLDCVVTAGDSWDNNDGADYRLWIDQDPVDSHLHASTLGGGSRGAASLRTAMRSAGVRRGIISWRNNRFVDRLVARTPGLYPLVWVNPRRTRPQAVRRRLEHGAVGLKLHPTVDRYPADDERLVPHLEEAAAAQVPVAFHSAPGPADPDRICRMAARFPSVPFVLYHTYLGPPEGRVRAARHASDLPNVYLETSWCGSDQVRALVDAVGADRVLFGSDAAVDGPHHFVTRNLEGGETYNDCLVALAGALGREAAQVLAANTRRLFRLPPAAGCRGSG